MALLIGNVSFWDFKWSCDFSDFDYFIRSIWFSFVITAPPTSVSEWQWCWHLLPSAHRVGRRRRKMLDDRHCIAWLGLLDDIAGLGVYWWIQTVVHCWAGDNERRAAFYSISGDIHNHLSCTDTWCQEACMFFRWVNFCREKADYWSFLLQSTQLHSTAELQHHAVWCLCGLLSWPCLFIVACSWLTANISVDLSF